MGYPKVTCDLPKLLENVNAAADLLHQGGRTFAAVTKSVCADAPIVDMLNRSRCDWIADSRVKNLVLVKTHKPRFLLRIAQPWETANVVAAADYSFQSEPETIRLLAREAEKQGRRHGIILAVDMGDLREGCFYQDIDDIERTAEAVLREKSLTLCGVGTNLGCFGGVKASRDNMMGLCAIARHLRTKYKIELPYVSGMSTLGHKMLLRGEMPEEINHARLSELWLTGGDAVNHCDVPGMHTDAFTLSAQVVEIKVKASKPIGEIGGDAFGHVYERPDLGPMRRGIIACGAQDTDCEHLVPLDRRIRILGGSSDHTLLDLSAAPEVRVGDIVRFRMKWGAVMRAYTSRYVEKEYIPLV